MNVWFSNIADVSLVLIGKFLGKSNTRGRHRARFGGYLEHCINSYVFVGFSPEIALGDGPENWDIFCFKVAYLPSYWQTVSKDFSLRSWPVPEHFPWHAADDEIFLAVVSLVWTKFCYFQTFHIKHILKNVILSKRQRSMFWRICSNCCRFMVTSRFRPDVLNQCSNRA